jgi:hypothetical protein
MSPDCYVFSSKMCTVIAFVMHGRQRVQSAAEQKLNVFTIHLPTSTLRMPNGPDLSLEWSRVDTTIMNKEHVDMGRSMPLLGDGVQRSSCRRSCSVEIAVWEEIDAGAVTAHRRNAFQTKSGVSLKEYWRPVATFLLRKTIMRSYHG